MPRSEAPELVGPLQVWAEAERARDRAAMSLAIRLRDGGDYSAELEEFIQADRARDEVRRNWREPVSSARQ